MSDCAMQMLDELVAELAAAPIEPPADPQLAASHVRILADLDTLMEDSAEDCHRKSGENAAPENDSAGSPSAPVESTPVAPLGKGGALVHSKTLSSPSSFLTRSGSSSSLASHTIPVPRTPASSSPTIKRRLPTQASIWQWHFGGRGTRGTIRPRNCLAPVRDLDPISKIAISHDHIAAKGEIIDWSVNLRQDKAKRLLSHRDPMHRFWKALRRLLEAGGVPVDVWGCLQVESRPWHPGALWHVHGAALCPHDRIEDFRDCLKRAAGDWTKGMQHEQDHRCSQTHIRRQPNVGWARYSGRDIFKDRSSKSIVSLGSMAYPFPTQSWFIAEELWKEAREAYEVAREASVNVKAFTPQAKS